MELWQRRSPESNLANTALLLLRQKGIHKENMLQHRLAMIQRNSEAPNPQEICLQINKEQDEAHNTSRTNHLDSCIIEEEP